MARRLENSPFNRHVVLPIVATILLVSAIVTGLLLSSVRSSDSVAHARQADLMRLVLHQSLDKVAVEQEASTVWNDAVVRLSMPSPDLEWLDNNLGIWFGTYYRHNETYILDPAERPVYAMRADRRVDPRLFGERAEAVRPLIRTLRARMRAGEEPAEGSQSLGAADFAIVARRPAIVSVKPVVPENEEVEQPAGAESLHVSIRYLDGSFAEELGRTYQFDQVRFVRDADLVAGAATFPIVRRDGRPIGYMAWAPFRPGRGILWAMAPALLVALLLVAGIVAVLIVRIRRSALLLIASEAQAQHLAFHDALTGLPNRARFDDQLDRELARVKRGNLPIALLYLDLDRFKHVNDSFGHPVGDELLRAVASRLQAETREVDTVARLGGDEFAVIQTGVRAPGETDILCLRLIESLNAPFEIGGMFIHVGVSIGIAEAPTDGVESVELTRKADIALYHAKAGGRHRAARFADSMDETVQRRREIEADLRQALAAGDQLAVSFQPLLAAGSLEVVGVEALARWNHPACGFIPPSTFVPIAEESGLIEALGAWVLREACTAMAPRGVSSLSVNVSPVQLRNPGFARQVLDLLDEVGMAPTRLELEITETCLIENADQYQPNIVTLRKAGVRIALDDFGTGYSSLAHLRQFSVDRVKIDRSFVKSIDRGDEGGRAIIQAIVDLARATRLKVTAEGVETKDQSRFLSSIGCNELQGYLLGRPMPLRELDSFLAGTAVAA